MYKEITKCRISGSPSLISVLNLGHQYLTGVFPKDPSQKITNGPLELVWCPESDLLQLKHSYSAAEMYGENYGYRSGLNASMVRHLQHKVAALQRLNPLQSGDLIVDIGSNDATTLKSYSTKGIRRLGIDPTGKKFASFYTDGVELVPDFFSKEAFNTKCAGQRAKIVTSIAMFYDLEDPTRFVQDIAAILAPEGIWHFEQSYMPAMLRTNAYDTICHEHLEYYSLAPIIKLLSDCGLKIIDVQMNATNGGSFAVTAAHQTSSHPENKTVIGWLLSQEDRMGLKTPRPFRHFEEKVFEHRHNLVDLIRSLRADRKTIIGYGASTKGNVLLQFCGLTTEDISCIAEVNPEKYGCYTPGTNIPIISEQEARAKNPDYFLVLPWHFKDGIIAREQEYLLSGGKIIFPLPEIEIVGG